MSNVKIYGPGVSSYVRSARMACIEKGVEHELLPVEFKQPSHFELHPWGKVPILQHGDVILYETSAICRYVDEAFDGPALIPGELHRRAVMEQWISAINSYIYKAVIPDYVLLYIFAKDGGPDRDRVEAGLPALEKNLALLDAAYSATPYIAGPDFSVGDILAAPLVGAASAFPEGREIVGKLAHLSRFLGEVSERPSFAQTGPKG